MLGSFGCVNGVLLNVFKFILNAFKYEVKRIAPHLGEPHADERAASGYRRLT
jgi:hypothetical protein